MRNFLQRVTRLLILALPLFALHGARAETHSSEALPIRLAPSMVALSGPWRFHTGDAAAWAQPGMDDSGWQMLDLAPAAGSYDPGLGSEGYTPGWTAFGHARYAGYAWYRLRVHLVSGGQPIALLMPTDVDDAYQVYANGYLIGSFGDFNTHPPRTFYGQPRIFRIPVQDDSDVELALRFYMRPASLLEDPTPGGLHSPPLIGLDPVAQAYYRNQRQSLTRTYEFYLLPVFVYLLASLAAFTLFVLDRSQRVFLWLGLAAILNVAYLCFVLAAILTARIDDHLLVLRPVLLSIVIWAWLLVWVDWFNLSRSRWLPRTIHALTGFAIALEWLQHVLLGRTMYPYRAAGPLDMVSRSVHLLLCMVPPAILWLAVRSRARDSWIAAPALLLLSITIYPEPLTWLHIPLIWFFAGVQVPNRLLAELLISLWVILLLLLRFQRSQRMQQQLQNEMRQAQQVQHTLLPDAPATLPGFRIESLYRPAAEVGGDFFQVLPSTDGGLLIVIGDVSGKGLRAAMLVSLIVGTLRTFAEQEMTPRELLEGMNRRLCGRMEGGFATCLCARICPDGAMTLANAGHLAPYLDGEEMDVPGGLPLGIITGAQYELRHYRLAPGSTIVFLTDGIVEARNRRGEIFGFDRTRMLTRAALSQIVRAAHGFQQDDDVTAIRVQREFA